MVRFPVGARDMLIQSSPERPDRTRGSRSPIGDFREGKAARP